MLMIDNYNNSHNVTLRQEMVLDNGRRRVEENISRCYAATTLRYAGVALLIRFMLPLRAAMPSVTLLLLIYAPRLPRFRCYADMLMLLPFMTLLRRHTLRQRYAAHAYGLRYAFDDMMLLLRYDIAAATPRYYAMIDDFVTPLSPMPRRLLRLPLRKARRRRYRHAIDIYDGANKKYFTLVIRCQRVDALRCCCAMMFTMRSRYV